jgi:peptidoglycan/LPS O-acetylase OafA/YrhL
MVEWIYKLTDISSIKRISFRQDINGLRAIAVLAVVFYHAELELFKGGWLGVDIFFVISGYLISNIIISELNDGTFSFKNFYLRRVRRILPALFSTLLLTLPFSYYFLTPKAMEEYIDSLIASVFFYANYHFMNLDFYVAESTKFMPLLHTWSLAIEEQYYLLFPLLAFLIYKYFRKYFTFFIGIITVVSLYLNTLSQSSDKFYRLEFRFWELLLGVLVMILSSNIKIKHLEKIGLPLMLIPIFYFDDNWINDIEPKLIALVGISLIIFSNTDTSILTRVLSLKIISIIGLSSYSIYLLHQPLFAFLRLFNESNKAITLINQTSIIEKNLDNLIYILIIIFLGYISYLKIELPFKKLNLLKNLSFLFIAIFICFTIFGKLNSGYINRFEGTVNELANEYLNVKNYFLQIDGQFCHKSGDDNPQNLCVINKNNQKEKIIILGSSMGRYLHYYLEEKIDNRTIVNATGDSCVYIYNTDNEKCSINRNNLIDLNYLADNSEKQIIVYFTKISESNINNHISTFEILSENNYLIIVKPTPSFPVKTIEYLFANPRTENIMYPNEEWLSLPSTIKIENALNQLKNNKNIFFIETFDIFCENIINNYCVSFDGENIFFTDSYHPSPSGSELIVLKIYEKILYIENLNK